MQKKVQYNEDFYRVKKPEGAQEFDGYKYYINEVPPPGYIEYLIHKHNEFMENFGVLRKNTDPIDEELSTKKEYFEQEKYKYQDDLVEYMKTHGNATILTTLPPQNPYTGERYDGEYLLLNDGVYSWTSDLPYYVEKYNIKLSDDFIEHVLKMTGKK